MKKNDFQNLPVVKMMSRKTTVSKIIFYINGAKVCVRACACVCGRERERQRERGGEREVINWGKKENKPTHFFFSVL